MYSKFIDIGLSPVMEGCVYLLFYNCKGNYSFLITPVQNLGQKRKIDIKINKDQFHFYSCMTVLALLLELVLWHSYLK